MPRGETNFQWLTFQSGVDWKHVSPRLLSSLNRLARDLGKKITVTSGFRTRAEQEKLYARYKASGFDIRYIAAKPGQSNHEKGLAVDATLGGVPLASAVPVTTLRKFGLVNPVKGDLVHTELSRTPRGTKPTAGATPQPSSPPSSTTAQPSDVFSGDPGLQTQFTPTVGTPTLPQPGQVYLPPTRHELAGVWQQMAQLPNASPETLNLAQKASWVTEDPNAA